MRPNIRSNRFSLMIRKASLYAAAFATIALTFPLVGRAQQASATDEKSETRTGSITGKVVNESGQPLANAAVFVRAIGSNDRGRNSTTTDADGTFQVSGLDPLAYTVFAALPAYTTAPRDPDSTQATYFRLGESVRIELIKGGVITGIVTSSAGEPIVGVSVRVYLVRDGNGQPSRYEMPSREMTTDDRGVYRIYGLATGAYIVAAGGGSGYYGNNAGLFETDVPTFAPASTRDTATEINVHAGEEVTNVDIRYRGEPGHIVSGVAFGGAGPSGFNVRLTSIVNGVTQSSAASYQPSVSRGFAFNGVADGDYEVTAEGFSPSGDGAVSEHRRIKVRGADLGGIELTTKPLGSISGRVVLEESRVPECKGKRRPLFAETLVSPWHNEKGVPKDQAQFLWAFGVPVVPDKQGDFTLRNLAPGQYRFNTRSLSKYWYLQSITLAPSGTAKTAAANRSVDAARNWTTLASGTRISGLIITFAEGAASFHGQIKLAEGEKLAPRMFAYLVPAERDKVEDILRFYVSQVAADGMFALNNLSPGRYWVLGKPTAEKESSILSKLRLPDETEARTKLRAEAEAAKTAIELKPCQNVTDYQLPFKPR
jgi:hypothetical protein